MFRKFICLCGLIVLVSCTTTVKEVKQAQKQAFIDGTPQRNNLQDALLSQCERAVQGKLVDAKKLAALGFTSSNQSSTSAVYEKNYASFKNALNKEVPVTMGATIIDISRHNEFLSKGKKNPFGIGCTSSQFEIRRVLSYLKSKGYKIQQVKRGKFSVRKGSLQFEVDSVVTYYGPSQAPSYVSMVKRL